MLVTTNAWSQASLQADMGTGAAKKDDKFKLFPTLSVDHNMGFRKDVDSTTDFTLFVSGTINREHNIQLFQIATKYYLVNPGESELLFSDTFLFHNWRLYSNNGFGIVLRNSYTLPISEAAQLNDTRGRLEQRLSFQKPFFEGKLFLGYRPFYRYFFNLKKQGANGSTLNRYSLGHSILAVGSLTPKLSLIGIFGHTVNFREESKFETQEVQTGESYFFNMFASYQVLKGMTARLGYLQANNAIINGRNEVYFFDEENSTWNIGLDYSF